MGAITVVSSSNMDPGEGGRAGLFGKFFPFMMLRLILLTMMLST